MMEPWESIAVRVVAGLLLGAIVGSFLGAALLRWPQRRLVVVGRSHCDSCGKALGPAELVPILSYLLQRGRCRACGSAIDQRHVAMEVGAAFVGALSFGLFGGWEGPLTALLGWWLLLTAALDVEHHWLPDRLTLPLIPLGLGVAALGVGPPLAERAIGAAAGFAALAALAFLYKQLRGRDGLGGGDPKLLAGLGAWIGWQQLPFVLLGAGMLGLASVLLRRLRGEAVAATDRLPLGALMALAAWPIWLLAAGF